jgi:hypothetical protein
MKDAEAGSDTTNWEGADIDEYWSVYREHVHTLLAWGYADSRHRVQTKHEEPDITGFITEAVRSRLDDPSSPSWCDEIEIHVEWMSKHRRQTGKNIFIHHILLDYCIVTSVEFLESSL